jgi:hypothetical protein
MNSGGEATGESKYKGARHKYDVFRRWKSSGGV